MALDLDGTLLNDEMRLTERTAACIRVGLAQGVKFVLATGRPYCSARPCALSLVFPAALGLAPPGQPPLAPALAGQPPLDLPLICHNGAIVRDAVSRRIHAHRPIPVAVAAGVADFLAGEGHYTRVYAADTLFVREGDEGTRWFSEHYGIPYEAVGDLGDFLRNAAPAAPSMLVAQIGPDQAALPSELECRWPEVVCYRPSPWGIDIVSAGTSKGAALRRLADGWGIPREAVLAAGNAGNDLDMVTWAGWGVAVANATPELLEQADWVAPDNNNEGVAEALERFVLTR